MRLTLVILAAFLLPACASVEMHTGKRPAKGTVKTVLLGNFEQRTLAYDPYVAANFRDALAFELFQRGYAVVIPREKALKKLSPADDQGVASVKEESFKSETAHPRFDLRVDGVLWESRWGDTLKTRTGAVVTVAMSLPDGTKIAEARYVTADPLSDPSSVRKITRGLAGKIYRSFGN